ncbi:hypothetical protein EVAR_98251_1 [Eumeta japonica]|uniref:Uncharacterized protein n=1 Tax=Eumeta variegata TaxID=151549 RepID=A0A4C1Y3Q1_EUMVA|nr:hypothetical protein EVAR_98251_1 [Eumeta japonica]
MDAYSMKIDMYFFKSVFACKNTVADDNVDEMLRGGGGIMESLLYQLLNKYRKRLPNDRVVWRCPSEGIIRNGSAAGRLRRSTLPCNDRKLVAICGAWVVLSVESHNHYGLDGRKCSPLGSSPTVYKLKVACGMFPYIRNFYICIEVTPNREEDFFLDEILTLRHIAT